MTHVAFLIPTLDRIAGAERQVILLANQFALRGWRVSVVVLAGDGGDSARQLASAGVGFSSLSMRKGLADPGGWLRFHCWLRQSRPEILHAHLPHAAQLARWSRVAALVPVVIDTIHSSATGPFSRHLAYRISAPMSTRVTAVSNDAAQSWLQARMIDPRNLSIVPNAIDTSQWKPDPAVRVSFRRERDLSSCFLWLAAGRLDPVKNYSMLLRALAQLPANAVLAIAGDGPQMQFLQQLAADLGIAARVRFLGFVPDILPWMQSADGFVQASHWEGLPTAILEAAACALPIVATAVTGTREVISHGRTGLLTPSGDPRALAQTMSSTMEMAPAKREAIGRHARQSVVRRCNLPEVMDRWESLYCDLLARNSSLGAAFRRRFRVSWL